MADIPRIKTNIRKMIDGGAQEAEIDQYLAIEGVTPDDLSQKYGLDSQPEKSTLGAVADYARGTQEKVSEGITFGLVDEARAAGQATGDAIANVFEGKPLDWGNSYDAAIKRVRGEQDQFSAENPITATTAEIGGAFVNPLSKMLPFGSKEKMLPKILKSGAAGATMGALYGGGNAEGGPANRLEGAAWGLGIGGLTGGVAPPVISGIGKGYQAIANQTINRLPQQATTAAQRKVVEALQADGLTLQQAEARLAELGPEAALLDVGPNSQSLARAVYTQPGEGKTTIGDKLISRQEGVRNPDTKVLEGGQSARVTQGINDLIPGDARATREAVKTQRTAQGANYEAAKAADDVVDVQPVIASLDDEIAKSKGGIRSALEKVRSYMVDAEGRPEITIDTLHQAKMAIDDLMSGEARTSMGNVAKARVRAYQDQLVDAIESAGEAGTKYRDGRLGTAAAWRINDALESGEQFMLKRAGTADDIGDMLKGMRPEEQEAFRTGAAQALKTKIGDMNNRSDVTKKLMDIPNLEAKIKTAFGSDEAFKKYITGLENEKTFFDAYANITKGSRTGEVLAEQADAGVDRGRIIQGIRETFMPNTIADIPQGLMNIAGGVKDRALLPAPMRSELGKILTGQDLTALRQTSQMAQLSDARNKALSRLLTSGGAVGGGNASAP